MKPFSPLKDWYFYTDQPPTGITWPLPTLKELTAIVAEASQDQRTTTSYTQQPTRPKTNFVTLPTPTK